MGSDLHTQNWTCSYLDGINFEVQKYMQDLVKTLSMDLLDVQQSRTVFSGLMRKPQSTSYSAEVILLCMEPKIGLWFIIKNDIK